MGRPALAASRGTRIIDLLAAFPSRRFSLTEIARAVEVNRASCHAILSELEQRGYLCRHPSLKTYWLGPMLVAVGQPAMTANPILARAQKAAERLRDNLGLPVLLSTAIGDEIVCIFSLCDGAGRTAGLRAGDRVPLVPPIGISFIAWSSPANVTTWIARRVDGARAEVARALRETIGLTRERGFHVTLRRPETEDITSILARLAASDRSPDFHRKVATFVETLDIDAAQPDIRDDASTNDVQLIAAPVFDPETLSVYNLCIGGFRDVLVGTAINAMGSELAATCVEIMQR